AYRTPEEREHQELQDPLRRTRDLLITIGAATENQLEEMEAEIEAAVAEAADIALASPQPDPSEAMTHLFSED
ncbi:MAG TPA: dehydrogenase, partial [Gemmatimonadetes bacterium]|nr:dehydrogenase [Gemmatimonadota bacterium]